MEDQSPTKDKGFLVVHQNGVILTKDNLAKRNWKGSLGCCSCSSLETIQHLFIDCHFARFIWNSIHITFGIQPPSNIAHMFGSWLIGIRPRLREHICVGLTTLCWAIWLNRNDMVFNRFKSNTSMEVIFRATYWTRTWSLLFKDEEAKANLKYACRLLETCSPSLVGSFPIGLQTSCFVV
jgi:hypothetical protein